MAHDARISSLRMTTGLALLTVLVVAGCAQPTAPGGPAPDPSEAPSATTDAAPSTASTAPAAPGLVPAGYTGRLRAAATVLESPDHGPQLCGMVATSYPPQCGGPDIIGWDWSTVTAESANGTTWGGYVVTGTWDGAALTLTEPAVVDDGTFLIPAPEPDFRAPCPEPAGGWAPTGPAGSSSSLLGPAMARAEASPGYAGAWIDEPRMILVVRTTGDAGRLETELRSVWGGNLCVQGGARFSYAELLAAQRDLSGEPGLSASGPDVVANRLDVQVLVATAERQQELDARFGVGLVQLHGLLQPLD